MPKSSNSSLFPDVNVWIALTLESHIHNPIAAQWLATVSPDSSICFCRLTQLSLLRLLTTPAVMGTEVMSHTEAWEAYDRWSEDARVFLLDEPAGLELLFRVHSRRKDMAPKDWMDSYLIAFAAAANLTLVSFDRGFRNRAESLLLLLD